MPDALAEVQPSGLAITGLQRGCSAAKQFGSLSVVKPAARACCVGACRGLVGSGQMIMSGVSCPVGPGRTLEIVRTVRLCRDGVRLVTDGALLRAALLSRLMSKVNRVGDGCRSKFAPSGGTIRCACGRCDCRRTLSYQTQVCGRAHRIASAAGQWRVGR